MRTSKQTMMALVAAVGLTSAGSAQERPVAVLYGQSRIAAAPGSILDQPARLQVTDVPLATALIKLAERSGVRVAFSPTFLPPKYRVECACESINVAEALDRLLANTEFGYLVLGEQVLILPRAESDRGFDMMGSRSPRVVQASTSSGPPLVVGMSDERLYRSRANGFAAADTLVAGVVVDSRAQPLRAARVVVAGTILQTSTDPSGRFRLGGLRGAQVTLNVTMIGYRPTSQTVRVGDDSLRIVMTEAAINLDELVVTGTAGATERRAIGTTVGKVDAAALAEVAPVSTVTQALNARVPGVTVMGDLGVIGAGPRIRIRGRTSISLKSDPIIYIDGIRVSNETGTGPGFQGGTVTSRLSDIDPNQIESIEIIKGPAAATLYGTEASNGVIQIITKRGTPNARPMFTISARQGANWFMNPEGRIQRNYNRDASGNLLGPFDIFASERAAGRQIFQTGQLGSYGLALSGGTSTVQYYAGTDLLRDNGAEPNNSVTRTSGRTNIDIKPLPQIDVNASLGFIRQRTELPLSEASICTVCMTIRAMPRLKDTPFLGFFNGTPYALREVVSMWQDVDRYTGGLRVNHRAGWFTQRLALGIDHTTEDDNFLAQVPRPEIAPLIIVAQWRAGQKIVDRRLNEVVTFDYGATAEAGLSRSLRSTTSAGFQYFGTKVRLARSEGRNFPAPGLEAVSAAAITLAQEDFVKNATVGMYVEQRFSLNDRLFITGAVRADDNSAFGENFNAVTYPKVSGSWVISDEPFWKLRAINQLKLRAAYGQSGQQPQTFAALQTYAATTGAGGSPALTPGSFGNPDLGPERGSEVEAGLEAALFQDRIGIDFTYYDKRTKDAILLRQNAPSSGFAGSRFVNAGLITNKGFELLIRSTPVRARSVKWDLTFNASTNRNKVVDLDPNDPSLTFIPTLFENRIAEGFPISGHFKQKVVSATYNPTTKRMDNILCDGGTGYKGLMPGGPGVPCASAPRVYLGQAEPKFEGAITNEVTMGRLLLRAQVDFKGGNKLFFQDRYITCTSYLICPESPGIMPETVDPVAAAEAQIGSPNIAVSHYISKADFLKLREVSVSYALPDRWARSFGASRARVTLAGRNLHTWTGYIGLDPESFRPHLLEADGGYSYRDQGGMPGLASFQVLVNLTF